VTGFSNRLGSHTLTATATNDAGLRSTSTLKFSVTGTCKVPKLKGKTLAAAKRALKHAHCKLGKTKPAHPSNHQKVTKSSPKAGARKIGGTKVKLSFG
jgi:beta-lactam-binding protein with PASTA domain